MLSYYTLAFITPVQMRAYKITESPSTSDKIIPNEFDAGIDYPYDLWFTLAKYIHPEHYGKFAALCKTSASVLKSMSFWLCLYHRFYDISSQHRLPLALRLLNINRSIRLRVNVIRALYYIYPPFRERSVAIVPNIHVHPELLIGRTCVLVWHEICPLASYSNQWRYYFKLSLGNSFNKCHQQSDIWRNPDEDCKLLQVICMNFVPIPTSLESLVLKSVSLRLTHSLRNYKLELQFDSELSARHKVTSKRQVSGVIILDPVVSLTILDWWHPNYPQSNIYCGDEEIIEDTLKSWDQQQSE